MADQQEETGEASEKLRGSTPEELVDILAFTLALDAYTKIMGEAVDPKVMARAKQIGLQLRGVLEVGLQTHIEPLIERPDAGILRAAWVRAKRPGPTQVMFIRIGDFVGPLFNWLKIHPQVMRDIFASGRAFTGVRRISQAALSEAPESILAQLASCPPTSRMRVPFRWISMAAQSAGTEPLPEQIEIVEGESVAPIVDDIRLTQSKLMVTDPTSEDAAKLEETKSNLESELSRAIETSRRPEAAARAGISSLTERPTLQIEQKYGTDEEQARIILETGRLVVSAGAGSGKTRTVVTKIEYTVKELGYAPEQILVTSFTNKASNELKERLEKRGIHGVRTGTTHNIAHEIIVNGRPDLREQLRKGTTFADSLFRMAIVQVGLRSGGGYSRYAQESWVPRTAAWGGRKPYGGGGGGSRGSGTGTPYWKTPADQWFNLGLSPKDSKGRALGSRRLRTLVGLWQSSQVPPDVAWAEWKDKFAEDSLRYFGAAVYGAYVWLKKNDPHFGPALDLDDWIPTAVKILQENKGYRDAVQRRFRFVGVDESQDQNNSQHQLFALLGEKADTYMMIGDDAQSIYAFRGAVPEQFIELPEKGFKLLKITTNYRSGKSIVDAANRLIAHNEDRQIPKVCRADVERRGMGEIRAVETETHEDAAIYTAKEISDSLKVGDMSPNDFGILVRNNAEADAYCLSLISRGIPFRCKRDFFSAGAIKSILSWMRIAVGSPTDAVNEAVTTAHTTPGFFLDKQFAEGLSRMCPSGQTYLDYLLAGGPVYTGQNNWRNAKMVTPYANVLREVHNFEGDAESLIRFILTLSAPRSGESPVTFLDSLVNEVDPDDLLDETSGVDITDEQLREAALAPLRPLFEMSSAYRDPAKFLDFIDRMKKANSKSRKGDEESAEPAVQIGTVHSWKGLERPHVYVSMAGGIFPHHSTNEKALAGDKTAFDEERRLAYVAITRGRNSVSVMSPQRNYLGKEAGISNFISEACIGFQGEVEPKPNDGTDEDVLRKEASDCGQEILNPAEDIGNCFGVSLATCLDENPENDQELFEGDF